MAEETKLGDWYTPAQAVARLEANAGRKIDPSTPRQLADAGKVRRQVLSATMSLYYKPDIDGYIVETRGQKAARSQRQRGLESKRKKPSVKPKKDGDAFAMAI